MNAINTKENTIKYEMAIVTFFDILGFKQLIETTKDEDVFEIFRLLSYFHWGHESGWNTHNAMFKFSDSMVRVIFLSENKDYHIKQLNEEILTISDIIENLFVNHGILIRGGMSFGGIYAKPEHNILFGPAMNRAYEIESKIAKWPRVMVDNYKEKIYINHEIEDRLSQFSPFTWNIWPYLEAEEDLYYIANLRHGDLRLQKERILEGIKKYKNEDRILEKFKWMMEEHNKGILNNFDHNNDAELKEFLISDLSRNEFEI